MEYTCKKSGFMLIVRVYMYSSDVNEKVRFELKFNLKFIYIIYIYLYIYIYIYI